MPAETEVTPVTGPRRVGRTVMALFAVVQYLEANLIFPKVVGRQLGQTHCRVYALRGAAGLPQTPQPMAALLRDAPWVAFERDSQARVYDQWMRKHLAGAQVRLRVDIFNAVAAMLHTGLAVGILPTFMAANLPGLVPVTITRSSLRPSSAAGRSAWSHTCPSCACGSRTRCG